LASGGKDGVLRLWNLDGSARGGPLHGHEGVVFSVAVSPSGELLASGGSDGTVWLWNLAVSERVEPRRGHEGVVWSVAFSPSGELLASGGDDGTVRLWIVDSGLDWPLRGHEGRVLSVAFSPSGEMLASGGDDGTVRLWNLDFSPRGEPLDNHEEPRQQTVGSFFEGRISSVSFSSSGVLASGGWDGGVRLWNLGGRARGEPFRGHKGMVVWSVAFSPSGEVLASGGEDGTVRLWNLDGSPRGEPLRHEGWFVSVAFSPSGEVLASSGSDGTVRLWNLDGSAQGQPLRGHEGSVWSVAFSPSGEVLASGGNDGTVRLWNLDGSARGEPLRGHEGGVLSVAFSPSGEVLASGGNDGTVRLWNLDGSARGEPLRGYKPLRNREGGVTSVAFSPWGTVLASGGSAASDRPVRLWNLDGSPWGEPLRHENLFPRSPIEEFVVAFSPSGGVLASAGPDGAVRLWNLDGSARGEPLPGESLRGHEGSVTSVAFSPRGGMLASGGRDGTVRLWNMHGNLRGEPLRHTWRVRGVAFSPSAEALASVGSDGAVRLWNLDGGARGEPLLGHEGWSHAVAFSPSGEVLASGGEDGTVRLWNLDGGARGEPLQGHKGRVYAVAFSPSGEVLASGSSDRTVRLWNLDGGVRGEPLRHESWVCALAFSPSGEVLASGGGDGTLRLWGLDGSARGEPLRGHEDGVMSVAFSPTGEVLASGSSDGTVWLWDVGSGAPWGAPLHHAKAVLAVAFSPSGEVLASAGSDGTVRLWEIESAAAKEITSITITVPIEVRFFASTLWSISSSGLLTFIGGDSRPAARMSLTPDGALVFTPEGLFSGDSRMLGRVLHFPGQGQMAKSQSDAFKLYYQPKEVVATIRGRSTWDVIRATVQRRWRETKTWYAELDWKAKIAFWPTAAYLALLLGVAATWLFQPAALAARAMPSLTDPDPPGWTLVLQWASLVHWMGRTQRPLDAWLRRHGEALVANAFADKDPVRYRRLYVDLDNESGLTAWRASADAGRPASCWITGPGGCGKSTLTFHLARRLRDAAVRRPLLPVLVDKDWHGPLLDEIGRQLEVGSRRADAWTVRKLVHTGRLAVIVDGLSERRAEGGEASVLELRDGASPRYLFVTSRSPDAPGEGFHKIELGPLADERLPAFVGAYVTGDEAGELVAALRRFTRGEPIRPLFARLAVEQLREGRGLPSSYALLVDGYVRGLRPQGAGALSEDDFLEAARAAAEACVETDLAPRAVDVAYLRARLRRDREKLPFCDDAGAELAPEAVLAQLLGCGLLEKVGSLGENRVQFADDPIAEYLMAMSVDHQRTSEWGRRLKRELRKAGEKARGLADALADVEASG